MNKRISMQVIKHLLIMLIFLLISPLASNQKLLAADFEFVVALATKPEYPWTKSMVEFDRLLNERTGGRIRLKIHHSAALGNERDIAESVMRGTIQMGVPSLNRNALWEKDFAVWGLPYLVTSAEDGIALMKGSIFNQMAEKYRQNYGVRILAPLSSGFRCIANNKRSVETINDLRDIKLRTSPDPLFVRTYSLMGAQSVATPFPEVFSSLKQGVIDGYENDPASHYAHKFYEVTKYLSITNTIFFIGNVIVNENIFQKLPADLQYIFLGTVDEIKRFNDEMFMKLTESAIDKLKAAGIKVNFPNLEQFKEAVRPVYAEYSEKLSKGLVEAVVTTAPRSEK
jgi:tripartite ATP-independent transporter DctP family solute receptor